MPYLPASYIKEQAKDKKLLEYSMLDCYGRFFVLLPKSLLEDPLHLMFQVQEAYWWYEDTWYDKYPNDLPKMTLKMFAVYVFDDCNLIRRFIPPRAHGLVFGLWREYCRTIPLRGAIILNADLSKCVLVKGWSRDLWGFPKGKVDESEEDEVCACREVYEELGINIMPYIKKYMFIEAIVGEQTVKLYIIPGVKEDVIFQPQTRKEIGDIRWFHLDQLAELIKTSSKSIHKKNITSAQLTEGTVSAVRSLYPRRSENPFSKFQKNQNYRGKKVDMNYYRGGYKIQDSYRQNIHAITGRNKYRWPTNGVNGGSRYGRSDGYFYHGRSKKGSSYHEIQKKNADRTKDSVNVKKDKKNKKEEDKKDKKKKKTKGIEEGKEDFGSKESSCTIKSPESVDSSDNSKKEHINIWFTNPFMKGIRSWVELLKTKAIFYYEVSEAAEKDTIVSYQVDLVNVEEEVIEKLQRVNCKKTVESLKESQMIRYNMILDKFQQKLKKESSDGYKSGAAVGYDYKKESSKVNNKIKKIDEKRKVEEKNSTISLDKTIVQSNKINFIDQIKEVVKREYIDEISEMNRLKKKESVPEYVTVSKNITELVRSVFSESIKEISNTYENNEKRRENESKDHTTSIENPVDQNKYEYDSLISKGNIYNDIKDTYVKENNGKTENRVFCNALEFCVDGSECEIYAKVLDDIFQENNFTYEFSENMIQGDNEWKSVLGDKNEEEFRAIQRPKIGVKKNVHFMKGESNKVVAASLKKSVQKGILFQRGIRHIQFDGGRSRMILYFHRDLYYEVQMGFKRMEYERVSARSKKVTQYYRRRSQTVQYKKRNNEMNPLKRKGKKRVLFVREILNGIRKKWKIQRTESISSDKFLMWNQRISREIIRKHPFTLEEVLLIKDVLDMNSIGIRSAEGILKSFFYSGSVDFKSDLIKQAVIKLPEETLLKFNVHVKLFRDQEKNGTLKEDKKKEHNKKVDSKITEDHISFLVAFRMLLMKVKEELKKLPLPENNKEDQIIIQMGNAPIVKEEKKKKQKREELKLLESKKMNTEGKPKDNNTTVSYKNLNKMIRRKNMQLLKHNDSDSSYTKDNKRQEKYQILKKKLIESHKKKMDKMEKEKSRNTEDKKKFIKEPKLEESSYDTMSSSTKNNYHSCTKSDNNSSSSSDSDSSSDVDSDSSSSSSSISSSSSSDSSSNSNGSSNNSSSTIGSDSSTISSRSDSSTTTNKTEWAKKVLLLNKKNAKKESKNNIGISKKSVKLSSLLNLYHSPNGKKNSVNVLRDSSKEPVNDKRVPYVKNQERKSSSNKKGRNSVSREEKQKYKGRDKFWGSSSIPKLREIGRRSNDEEKDEEKRKEKEKEIEIKKNKKNSVDESVKKGRAGGGWLSYYSPYRKGGYGNDGKVNDRGIDLMGGSRNNFRKYGKGYVDDSAIKYSYGNGHKDMKVNRMDYNNTKTFGANYGNGWSVYDMFKRNKEKFGVESTYNFDDYTTPLYTSDYKKKIGSKRGESIVGEISTKKKSFDGLRNKKFTNWVQYESSKKYYNTYNNGRNN